MCARYSEVPMKRERSRTECAVHSSGHLLRARLAETACRTDCGQCVPTVASFSQSVGAETETDSFVHNFFDDGLFGPFIKVVHNLCALVTKKSGVLKPYGAFHGTNGSRHTPAVHERDYWRGRMSEKMASKETSSHLVRSVEPSSISVMPRPLICPCNQCFGLTLDCGDDSA